MKYTPLLFIFFILSLTSCSTTNNEGEPTPPIGTFEATVEGELQQSNGIAASNTRLVVFTHTSDCDEEGVSQGVATTNSRGLFNRQIIDVVEGRVGCITLEISSNPQLGLPDTTVNFPVDLELRLTAPFDREEISFTY